METLFCLPESATTWLTPNFTTWAMDMILALVCGLGLFHLLIILSHLKSPSSPPPKTTTTTSSHKVAKREQNKVRKKSRIVKAYRGSRKKPKEDKVLVSLLHSMLEKLVDTINFCQVLRKDGSRETSKPEAAKVHLPPKQPTEESVATSLSLVASSAPLKEYLMPKDSKILSPVLLDSSPSVESQSSVSASQPPEILTPGRHHFSPWAPFLPSHPSDPMVCPPSIPVQSTAAPRSDWKSLGASQNIPSLGLPSPIPTTPGLDHSSRPNSTTPGLNHSSRPTSTTPGLNYSSRPTSTNSSLSHSSRPTSTTPGLDYSSRPTSTTPGINHSIRPTSTMSSLDHSSRPTSTTLGLAHSSRPTSTTPGLNHSSRPTSTTPGLDHSSRPISTSGLDHSSRPSSTTPGFNHSNRPTLNTSGHDHSSRPTSTTPGFNHANRPTSGSSWYQVAAKTWCHSNSSHGEFLQKHISLSLQEALFWIGSTYRKVEAKEHSFANPDIQEMLELQTSKKVELQVWKGKGKEKCEHSFGCISSMMQSWSSKQTTTRNCKSKKFSGQQFFYQEIIGNNLQDKCSQLFWGHPFLHSESLVATVNVAGSPLDLSSILFNGLSTSSPIQVQTDVPPQVFSPKPLFHHVAKSQPLTPKISWSQSPLGARIQTQAHDPSSLPKLPCHSPLIRDHEASPPTASRSQFTVPPAVGHLEHHFIKKHQESRSALPAIVQKSQEAFNQLTSNSWAPQGQGSVVFLPGKFIDADLREQLEQHLKARFTQHQGQLPRKVQLSLDLRKSQVKLLGMGQAEVNHGTSCSSVLTGESGQHPQSVSSKSPEIFQIWKDPSKGLTNCQERSRKDLYRSPEGKVLEAISETEAETNATRHPRRDSLSVSPVGPGKKHLEGTLRDHSSCKWGHTNDSKVPVGICHGIRMDHALVPPEKNTETWNKSMNHWTTHKKTSNGPSFLDPDTQKVLEKHLTRRLVRHRWSLPLRGLKTMHVFDLDKGTTLPITQPCNSLNSSDSREVTIVKEATALGEFFQRGPEETSTVESLSTQNPPPVLQLKFLRGDPPSGNSGHNEAPKTVQGDSMSSPPTQHSLVGRAWHLGSQTGNPEPNPSLIKGWYQSQQSEGVALRNIYQHVSVREISVVQQSPSRWDNKKLEKAEEKETCDWALTMEAGEMANPQNINEYQKDLESLEINESPSRIQDLEDSSLSTPHCSDTGVVLQDYATGAFLQDCAPEVLLAADILASRSSQSSFKTVSTTSKSTSQDRELSFRERNVPKTSKPQELWTSHEINKTDRHHRHPRQHPLLPEKRPAQAYISKNNGDKFGERIKNFILSIFIPTEKGKKSPQRLPSRTQSQRSVISKVFMPQQVAEAQDLMTSVGWGLEKKLGVRHRCVPSKRAEGETSCVHQANPKVHSQHFPDKWMPNGKNLAQVSREPGSKASLYQDMEQSPCVPGTPTHCPRHCLYRRLL